MPDQTVIRTETIAGRTYALVKGECEACAFHRDCAQICVHPKQVNGCFKRSLDIHGFWFGRFIELPHADRGE